jgi:hypothetical protein
MKALAFLLIVTAAPAFAQESSADGSILEALKVGDWVSYSSATTRELLDLTVVEKPVGTTIKAYRDKLAKERDDTNSARNKLNEAMRELQTANISAEERSAKLAEFRRQQEQAGPFGSAARGMRSALYEVKAIRKECVVVSSGTQERFIAKSAVRMIIRNLPAESAKADKK